MSIISSCIIPCNFTNNTKTKNADIFHDLIIKAPVHKVFAGISTPQGLDAWWTMICEAEPVPGGQYILNFGASYIWKATVTKYEADTIFELLITDADADWANTNVGFILKEQDNKTLVSFYHTGWQAITASFKYSSYCWAMYLQILKRHIEFGEEVPYAKRLSV